MINSFDFVTIFQPQLIVDRAHKDRVEPAQEASNVTIKIDKCEEDGDTGGGEAAGEDAEDALNTNHTANNMYTFTPREGTKLKEGVKTLLDIKP